MPSTSLIRERIFQRFPWLQQGDNLIVVSTDMDGLLSSALLHHHLGWQVAGYYNGINLWLSADAERHRDKLIWVNLDICRPDCASIGHHVLTLTGKLPAELHHVCNPNLLMGTGVNDFHTRYPFSTLLFLLWLHNLALRKDLMARLLVLCVGSVWIEFQLNNKNCRLWLDWLPDYNWNWLFQQVDTELFERRMRDHLYERMHRMGVSGMKSDRMSRHLKLPGDQLQFNPDWDDDVILGLYNLAGTHLKWSPPRVPEIKCRIEGQSSFIKLNAALLENFPAALLRRGAFSYAIARQDAVNFTQLDW